MNNDFRRNLKQYFPSQSLPSKTILLVDDDSDIRALTRTFLEHEGYRVLCCGDAERAGQVFQTAARIDLLITDFYMPQTTGMELAISLKQQNPKLPVLLISGGLIEADHLEQLRQDGWRFLGKPFALPELLTTVHAIFGSNEMQAIA